MVRLLRISQYTYRQSRICFWFKHEYGSTCVKGRSNLQTIIFETIGGIRKYLTAESTLSAVISLVTSRFDYCNGLCGIPEELICKLQRVQNNAAREITLTKKYDHIIPVLIELPWLPVRMRIEFMILLLASKCLHGTAPFEGNAERVCPTTDTDLHPTYSVSHEPTWKPTVTDRLVPVPLNYGIISHIIFGQLRVWQSSNDNWKHIGSKMYISINYVDINIILWQWNVMRLWALFKWKSSQNQMTILLLLLLLSIYW